MPIELKYLTYTIFGVFFFLSIGEIFARYFLGLGTPPLSISDPRIEYMFKPNQDVYRFGNHFITNQYGMRSEPFTKKKVVMNYELWFLEILLSMAAI